MLFGGFAPPAARQTSAVFFIEFSPQTFCTSIWNLHFAFVFGLYMIAAMAYTFYAERGLNNKTVGTDRLVDTGRRLIRLKRLQARWLRISIPISVILLTWMYLEVTPELSYSIPFYRGCGFGAVFGGVIAAIIYMKRRRELKECIRQIEDLTGEKLD